MSDAAKITQFGVEYFRAPFATFNSVSVLTAGASLSADLTVSHKPTASPVAAGGLIAKFSIGHNFSAHPRVGALQPSGSSDLNANLAVTHNISVYISVTGGLSLNGNDGMVLAESLAARPWKLLDRTKNFTGERIDALRKLYRPSERADDQ